MTNCTSASLMQSEINPHHRPLFCGWFFFVGGDLVLCFFNEYIFVSDIIVDKNRLIE